MTSLAPALKHGTRPAHERLEARLDLLGRLRDVDAYRDVLCAMRGVYAPLEDALAAAPGMDAALPDHRERRKLPLLDADLRDLGVDPAALAVCTDVPPTDTTARALGVAYVLEGATLGGAHVRRHVRAHVPPPGPDACRFLAPYGERTGAMWRTFQAALARYDDGRDGAQVLAAADETFRALEAWLDVQGVLR